MTDNINVIEATPTYVTIGFTWTPTIVVPVLSFTGAYSKTALTFTATAVIENQDNDLQGPLTIVEYYWDFGDGVVGYGNPVTHNYSQAFFNAATSLRVTDSKGRQWFTRHPMYVTSAGHAIIVGVSRDLVSIIDNAMGVPRKITSQDVSLTVSDIATAIHRFFAAAAFDASVIIDSAGVHAPAMYVTINDTSLTLVAVARSLVIHRAAVDVSAESDNARGIRTLFATDSSLGSDSVGNRLRAPRIAVETSITFDNATGAVVP